MSWQVLTTFTLLCMLLAVTPGPDSFLVLRFAMSSVRAGVAAGIGSSLATLGWAVAVSLGLAAVLEQSAVAFRVVKVAGGLYLLWLGASTFVRHRRSGAEGVDLAPRHEVSTASAFRAGLVSTTLNPKVGLFFIAVVPQFLRDDHAGFAATMLLGAITAVVGGLYLAGLSLVARTAVNWLRRPRVADGLERVSAAILAALGLGTLVSATQ
jgi:threonine/homoserine/homoserine lactone efflux protein